MKKNATKKYLGENGEKTAEYIIAHAKLQKSRGRNLSETYKGESNPQKALQQALHEKFRECLKNSPVLEFKVCSASMIKLYPLAGSDITTNIAPKMIGVANATGFTVFMNYRAGGFTLTTNTFSTINTLVKEWFSYC